MATKVFKRLETELSEDSQVQVDHNDDILTPDTRQMYETMKAQIKELPLYDSLFF